MRQKCGVGCLKVNISHLRTHLSARSVLQNIGTPIICEFLLLHLATHVIPPATAMAEHGWNRLVTVSALRAHVILPATAMADSALRLCAPCRGPAAHAHVIQPATAMAEHGRFRFAPHAIIAAARQSGKSRSFLSLALHLSHSPSFISCLVLPLKSVHLCGRFLPHDRRDVATHALESIAPRTLLRPDADELLKGVRRRNSRKHNIQNNECVNVRTRRRRRRRRGRGNCKRRRTSP